MSAAEATTDGHGYAQRHGERRYTTLAPPVSTVSVVVDVEEEFDWTKPFSSQSQSVAAADWINLGHTLMRSLGITPAYLLTYPVAASPRAAGLFREMVEEGGCDIGAQLHPWVTPPIEEQITTYNSFPSNIPAELERRKNAALMAQIEQAIGVTPSIYKAGRYGLDLARAEMLADLGFRVDTSIMPYHDFSPFDGGPDFFGLPDQPFWLDKGRRLLGLPSTQGLVGHMARALPTRVLRAVYSEPMVKLRVPGVLSRLGILERLRLSPEGSTFEACKRLIDANAAHGPTCFVLSFHSPSLSPGCTPYVRDQPQLNAFLENLHATLSYLTSVTKAKPMSLLELHAHFSAQG